MFNNCINRPLFVAIFFAILLFFPRIIFAQVIINEFVPDSSTEWVEFYNASDGADYLKSYWLDDDTDFNSDSGSSAKKALTNINTTNISYPYFEMSSFLNNPGDYVVLFDAEGNIIDQYQYTSNPGSEISIGRYPDNTGSFTILSSSTKGAANSDPAPTPTPTPDPTLTPSPSPLTPSPTLRASAIPTPTPSKPSPPPTSTPTKKPTPSTTPKASPTPTSETEFVLAAATTLSPTASLVVVLENKSSSNILPIILVGAGLLFLIVSGFLLLKTKNEGYNN